VHGGRWARAWEHRTAGAERLVTPPTGSAWASGGFTSRRRCAWRTRRRRAIRPEAWALAQRLRAAGCSTTPLIDELWAEAAR
jgi:hypothetical protein